MTARNETTVLMNHLNNRGIKADFEAANTLRRAQLTLHRWSELECGNGNDYSSWSIERDEVTGKPYFCRYPNTGKMTRSPVADRETGALQRIAETCQRIGAHYHHQTDPRGCALYVSAEPMTDYDYSRGVACCA